MNQMHYVHRDMLFVHPVRCTQQKVAGPDVMRLPHGITLWLVVRPVPVVGDVGVDNTDGAVSVPGGDGLEPRLPRGENNAVGVGTVMSGLTPAPPISTDPRGIPVRETPFGEVERADKVEDAASLEAAPQIAAPPGNAVPSPIPSPAVTPPPS
jgi:hypothetical protein